LEDPLQKARTMTPLPRSATVTSGASGSIIVAKLVAPGPLDPVSPLGPASPLGPDEPGSPFGPASPLGPDEPGSPFGPVLPLSCFSTLGLI
jgi:hypothetical protein